jgi:uncharacterized surface anchored protein
MTRAAVLAFAMVLLLSAPAAGQTATGSITGVVRDSTGAVLPDAAITIRNVATSSSRTATTDTAGRYSIVNVVPGDYELRAALTGFTASVRTIVVTVGGMTEANIDM